MKERDWIYQVLNRGIRKYFWEDEYLIAERLLKAMDKNNKVAMTLKMSSDAEPDTGGVNITKNQKI